jgi:hypothetical protein
MSKSGWHKSDEQAPAVQPTQEVLSDLWKLRATLSLWLERHDPSKAIPPLGRCKEFLKRNNKVIKPTESTTLYRQIETVKRKIKHRKTTWGDIAHIINLLKDIEIRILLPNL